MTSPQNQSTSPQLLSDSKYELLKKAAMLLLPGLATLYYALAMIWGLPYAEQIVGTIAAVNLFVGVLVSVAKMLHDATKAPYDGSFTWEANDEGGSYLRLEGVRPEALQKEIVTFRIKPPSQ